MRFIIIAALFLFTAACGGMPKHAEVRNDLPAQVTVSGAPIGAAIIIDGRIAGYIADGKNVFSMEPGSRKLQIRVESTVIYEREIFIQKGTTRNIDLRS